MLCTFLAFLVIIYRFHIDTNFPDAVRVGRRANRRRVLLTTKGGEV